MSTSIYALATSLHMADHIVDELCKRGHRADDISLLFPDQRSTRDFAHERHTKAPEGATLGLTTGGALGGTLGWLVGIGTLAIPGLGLFVAAGPLLAALSVAAIGATIGGVAGALIGMGVPEYEAKRYEGKLREGRILISVTTEDPQVVEEIIDVYQAWGASDIASAAPAHQHQ